MSQNENLNAQRAWNTNAEFWNQRMADGNDFFNILIWPSLEKLLQPIAGERLLDAVCGNGVTSRRLAHAGVNVTAFDFADSMIALAKKHGNYPTIDYRIVDATNCEALLVLGTATFDGALRNMALFDMADIAPLMKALPSRLGPMAASLSRSYTLASIILPRSKWENLKTGRAR
jgi:2-polyprenyl-3-methyl-5-hydroxy-6-metoxy-1,4-benzoquinol methylase